LSELLELEIKKYMSLERKWADEEEEGWRKAFQ